MFRILSIDGGGIRGLIPALILDSLEQKMGLPIWKAFDLIAGTSTGGIITCALTKPNAMSAKEVVEIYSNHGKEIFNTSGIGILKVLWNSHYSNTGIEELLYSVFEGVSLSSSLIPILVTAYNPQTNSPFFFRSESAKRELSRDFPMREVARATSAAPTFFPPAKVRSLSGEDLVLLDGGLFANNPTMCAVADACARHHRNLEDLMILSLGTGSDRSPIMWDQIENAGILSWIKPLLSMLFAGSSEACDWQVAQLVSNYTRIDLEPSVEVGGMDDVSPKNIANLTQLAKALIKNNQGALDKIANFLAA